MKTITLDRDYSLKESLTYAEEGEVNIISHLMPIVVKMGDAEKVGQKDDSAFMQALLTLLGDPEFRKKGIKLVQLMCLEPKMTEKDIGEKESSVVLGLQLECIKTYIKAFGNYLGKKKASPKAT